MTAYSNVSKHDPHKILGLNHNASKDEIRRAYKRLIQKYHPDKYQSNISFALKKTKALNQAYAILSGKIRRQWTVTKRKVKKYVSEYPHLVREWHPTKNGDLTPDNVTHGSGKLIWWVCRRGHEYQRTVHSRTRRVFYMNGQQYYDGAGCTVCKKLTEFEKTKLDFKIWVKKPKSIVGLLLILYLLSLFIDST